MPLLSISMVCFLVSRTEVGFFSINSNTQSERHRALQLFHYVPREKPFAVAAVATAAAAAPAARNGAGMASGVTQGRAMVVILNDVESMLGHMYLGFVVPRCTLPKVHPAHALLLVAMCQYYYQICHICTVPTVTVTEPWSEYNASQS